MAGLLSNLNQRKDTIASVSLLSKSLTIEMCRFIVPYGAQMKAYRGQNIMRNRMYIAHLIQSHQDVMRLGINFESANEKGVENYSQKSLKKVQFEG
jgi:hypothetical protein